MIVMPYRTFGWVQNPSSFKKLKKVVQIFDINSEHYAALRDHVLNLIYFEELRLSLKYKFNQNIAIFSYKELVGTSLDKLGKKPKVRRDAVADGIIQVSILPQNYQTTGKMWTDNWTADGYLRWAVSLNFVEYDRINDTYFITEKGLAFSQSIDDSEEEKAILIDVLLAYPPACQILMLLKEKGDYCTKYYLGSSLGFIGERGFTSYSEDIMIDWYKSASDIDKRKIKSDVEGTSDKYARGICNWLKQLGLVTDRSTKYEIGLNKYSGFKEYCITGQGIYHLNRSQGSSKNKKIKKFVMWEFFATQTHNREYVRTRRAYLLKFLKNTTSKRALFKQMATLGFNDDISVFESDIKGLCTFGLRINQDEAHYRLLDDINDFTIPELNLSDELKDSFIDKKKSEFLANTAVPVKYLELLEIAYDGKRNRDFEILTIDLFRNVYQFDGILLGGGRKPDGLIFSSTYGVIVDTKAYGEGYSKSINQADEMIRYIEDNKRRDEDRNPNKWWLYFPDSLSSYYFLWVSSKFVGKFEEQVVYTAAQTQTNGGALNVEQLLYGADFVLKGLLDVDKIEKYFNNNVIIFK